MSYLNPTHATDIHFKQIAGDYLVNIADELALLDLEIENVCYSFGIDPESIPVDGQNYITSATLIDYALYWIYTKVLTDHWGAAHGENDIYYEKVQRYDAKTGEARGKLTGDNILMIDPEETSFASEIIIY